MGDVTIQPEAVVLPAVKHIFVSRDMSLGVGQTFVTGVGFRPSGSVSFVCRKGVAANMGISMCDGIGNDDGAYLSDNTNANDNHWDCGGGGNIGLIRAPTVYQGKCTSFDSDGITIDWSGSGTGNFDLNILFFK